MKNIPEKIYLQVEEDVDFDDDFNELSTTWCKDKINKTDIEYMRTPKNLKMPDICKGVARESK